MTKHSSRSLNWTSRCRITDSSCCDRVRMTLPSRTSRPDQTANGTTCPSTSMRLTSGQRGLLIPSCSLHTLGRESRRLRWTSTSKMLQGPSNETLSLSSCTLIVTTDTPSLLCEACRLGNSGGITHCKIVILLHPTESSHQRQAAFQATASPLSQKGHA